MKCQLKDIEIVNGTKMSSRELSVAARNVSLWLDASVPHTKRRSSGELMARASESLYATYDGHAVGHVALREYSEYTVVELGSDRGLSVLRNASHYGIGSLVVGQMRGVGIGGLLIDAACGEAEDVALFQAQGDCMTQSTLLISAIAGTTSRSLFEASGFVLSPELQLSNAYAERDLALDSGKVFMSKVVGHHE